MREKTEEKILPKVSIVSRRNRKIRILLFSLFLIAFVFYLIWENSGVDKTRYHLQIPISEILNEHDEAGNQAEATVLRIAHLSDVHNEDFGNDYEEVLEKLREEELDFIALTGDLIDSYRPNLDSALYLVEKLVEIAPVYYVNGNHEQRFGREYELFKQDLENLSVHVLENASSQFTKENIEFAIMGVNDPSFVMPKERSIEKNNMQVLRNFQSIDREEGLIEIVLSHRPMPFPLLAKQGVSLVLSGHTHGGQFRLPFLGGILSVGEGLFPYYDGGYYQEGNSQMILSRGIGNSFIPFRVFNRGEVIIIELEIS